MENAHFLVGIDKHWIFNRKRKDTEKYFSPFEINACLLIFDINYTLHFSKYKSMLIFEKLSIRKYLL